MRITLDLIEQYRGLFVGRLSDHSIQLENGLYARVGQPLSPARLAAHLHGDVSLATYVINDQGQCTFAVMDADQDDGLDILGRVQDQLADVAVLAHLEMSRRGGHLWFFLSRQMSPRLVRTWLLPFCPRGVEFYPKQDQTRGYGSAIRLPFGIHRRSGRRYPFVQRSGGNWKPVADSIASQVSMLTSLGRAAPPPDANQVVSANPQKKLFSQSSPFSTTGQSIRDWCALQNPFVLIGRYIDLDTRGMGHCPFGWHHDGGRDEHRSFKVYQPGVAGGYCWYCHSWDQGGSVFDFLRHYHNLDARELWRGIKQGVMKW
jgi:hypothetical protein